MKFRKKPIAIDAVQYIKGMEDGFTESFECGLDVPYVQNANDANMYLISDGDWIITENGRRRACSYEMFHENYEPVGTKKQQTKTTHIRSKHWGPDDDYLTVEIQVDSSIFSPGEYVKVTVEETYKPAENPQTSTLAGFGMTAQPL